MRVVLDVQQIQHAVRGESPLSHDGRDGRDVQLGVLNPSLSWTHYRTLLKEERQPVRDFYEIESVRNGWSARQLERQMHSFLFERLAKSRDKQGVLALANEGQALNRAQDVIKDPHVLEFLDLPQSHRLVESRIEEALINQLQAFLLELGSGFAFVGRQCRLTLDGDHFYPDLVFYHVKLKCYVVIDLKVGKLKGEVRSGFKPFTLDVSGLHLQPKDRSLVGQNLGNREQFTLSAQSGGTQHRPEDYIVHALIDYDDIDYNTQASLLYDLAGQVVAHLRSYLKDEDEVRNVLDLDRQLIARNVYAQMHAHFEESASGGYTADVRRGFTALKAPTYTVGAGQVVRDYRETPEDLGRIKQMVFGGFSRCLYPLQKFDSDTERKFAVLLERDADKWLKPAKGQFQMFYKLGAEQPEYVPDFVAETAHHVLMVETKASKDMDSTEVKVKAQAGALWCKNATDHTKSVGGKPWKYLLVSHEQVTADKTLNDFLRFEKMAASAYGLSDSSYCLCSEICMFRGGEHQAVTSVVVAVTGVLHASTSTRQS